MLNKPINGLAPAKRFSSSPPPEKSKTPDIEHTHDCPEIRDFFDALRDMGFFLRARSHDFPLPGMVVETTTWFNPRMERFVQVVDHATPLSLAKVNIGRYMDGGNGSASTEATFSRPFSHLFNIETLKIALQE